MQSGVLCAAVKESLQRLGSGFRIFHRLRSFYAPQNAREMDGWRSPLLKFFSVRFCDRFSFTYRYLKKTLFRKAAIFYRDGQGATLQVDPDDPDYAWESAKLEGEEEVQLQESGNRQSLMSKYGNSKEDYERVISKYTTKAPQPEIADEVKSDAVTIDSAASVNR